jgi:hypothetical protein
MNEKKRYFRYVGAPLLTRGDYGVGIRGGHSSDDGTDICTFDPDFGDRHVIGIEEGLSSGDWVEVSKEEWDA